ncbi:beta-N-acetylglucosaminidase domain-containing protein [Streptomyces albidoflavus]|uniref:beta-N-acetylglucosaminidase domain-containing protein n=1 Tax=Streptomyces albidoflavus TaxID=1886 RepID=UPI0035E2D264
MQLRRSRTAAALAVAVIAGTLGGAPTALAAPPAPDPATAADEAPDDAKGETAGLPSVWPRPQSLRAADGRVALGSRVVLLAPIGTDPYALKALREVLREAGVRDIDEVSAESDVPAGATPVVRVGGESAARASAGATGLEKTLRALGASARDDLPQGGYRLAAGEAGGRPTVAMAGVGEDGLFHAVQTLRQLVRDGVVPGVVVRDWPGTPVRGLSEGFYGTPWTTEQRLGQLDFLGRTKQNHYLYAPGDDLFRQARWREPYPAEQRTAFRSLAERARENHVTLAWAVAPGQAMCLASEDDVKALNRKIDAMWALGARAFQLQFQDVSYSEWHCGEDEAEFGSGPAAAARAQARVANAVAAHLAERHPGSRPLSLMPTEYYQKGATEYRRELATELEADVQVAWTGVGVVPRTITGRELAGTREVLDHPLVTLDNYPVNDYAQDRIFLGPYTGREPAVATGSAALIATAMEQPAASRIPLFTSGDYAWNPKDYRPMESWQAAMDTLAGEDPQTREAVRALARNTASSVLGADESAYLRPLLAKFWATRADAARAAGRPGTEAANAAARAAKELRAAFSVMRATPERLDGGGSGLGEEVRPWSEQLARFGQAGELAVDLLAAQARGDGTAAWHAERALRAVRAETSRNKVTVGDGVLGPFLDQVEKTADSWHGTVGGDGEKVADTGSAYTVALPRVRPLAGVTVRTDPGVSGVVEARVPGKGWQPVTRLEPGGWTDVESRGLHADALRVTGPEAERVDRLVPWYEDGAEAALRLGRGEADAEIGGKAGEVTARLTAHRPGTVRGALKAKTPEGIQVSAPGESVLPRGTEVRIPVSVRVADGVRPGSYEVPVEFGGRSATLTVRAFPPTEDRDLVRSGKATSSADETEDFPARAAADGDPESRWSSPAEDNAWWQTELPEPARVGRVELHWQDAYAAAYRVQVSEDGRIWRTAATVKDGKGGRERVGLDAKNVRFLRVQGDKRATRYGYSLFSVEAYAVAEREKEKGEDKGKGDGKAEEKPGRD